VSAFIDTNVLVYALGSDRKSDQARALIGADNVIAVQSLNEFTVVTRRMRLSWEAIDEIMAMLRAQLQTPVPLTLDIHEIGLLIARRYQLQIYDSMLLAAALQAGCTIFYSEDMADGLVIDGRLTISNPFG
jgi:predicted nucleic acid-binding protein